MNDHNNDVLSFPQEPQQPTFPLNPEVVEEKAVLESPVAPEVEKAAPDTWHAAAGRKGALRVHQLMQLGLLYEKEHGLKRGRQRVRQLIEEGRLYEQEHGLASKTRRPRRERLKGDQLMQSFLRTLQRMLKPSYREKLARLLEKVDAA